MTKLDFHDHVVMLSVQCELVFADGCPNCEYQKECKLLSHDNHMSQTIPKHWNRLKIDKVVDYYYQ